jgi:hypothetical protein
LSKEELAVSTPNSMNHHGENEGLFSEGNRSNVALAAGGGGASREASQAVEILSGDEEEAILRRSQKEVSEGFKSGETDGDWCIVIIQYKSFRGRRYSSVNFENEIFTCSSGGQGEVSRPVLIGDYCECV